MREMEATDGALVELGFRAKLLVTKCNTLVITGFGLIQHE